LINALTFAMLGLFIELLELEDWHPRRTYWS